MTHDPIVIVGAGLAGYTVARELRKRDPEVPLLMVTADDGHFYAKPMLSNAFAQRKTPAQLVGTPADDMSAQLRMTLLTRVRVTGLDVQAKRLSTSLGDYAYSRLVLATGADPIRLPLAGDAADRVLSVNDLEDYGRFHAQLGEGARRIVILGAGLIGAEFANDLVGAGHAVTVVDPATSPLAALLPAQVSTALATALQHAGVEWRFGRTAASVDAAADGALAVTLSDGERVSANLVLSAVGLRPRTSIAQAAGLKVDRGIVVDALHRTSDQDVFAIGDCAQVEGEWRPYVLPIMTGARALAATLAGEPTPAVFGPMPVSVKTPALPVVVLPPPRGREGRWEPVDASAAVPAATTTTVDDFALAFVDANDVILGFALTGKATARRAALLKQLGSVAVAA